MNPVILESFKGEHQAQDKWCWAAAIASIYNYYRAKADPAAAHVPQCVFVHDQLPQRGCLRFPRSGDCIGVGCFDPEADVPEYLDIELDKYGFLECTVYFDGTDQDCQAGTVHGGFDADEIRTWIDEGRPVALRVLKFRASGLPLPHFLIVTGYHPIPEDRFVVWDPDFGERHVTLEELTYLYGTIRERYLTRQAPPEKQAMWPAFEAAAEAV